MWGSAIVGDTYDAPIINGDDFTKSVYNSLSQHPNFIMHKLPLVKSSSIYTNDDIKSYNFPKNGDGWLEATYGKDANSIIRMCRKMRRNDKSNRDLWKLRLPSITYLGVMDYKTPLDTWVSMIGL